MHKQINQLRASLMAQFPERKDIIDGSLAAVLAGEHVLLIGPPGTAKSALVRCLAQVFGGSYFERLLTKFSTPEELFGPISLQDCPTLPCSCMVVSPRRSALSRRPHGAIDPHHHRRSQSAPDLTHQGVRDGAERRVADVPHRPRRARFDRRAPRVDREPVEDAAGIRLPGEPRWNTKIRVAQAPMRSPPIRS
jgi:hypothetical protein